VGYIYYNNYPPVDASWFAQKNAMGRCGIPKETQELNASQMQYGR
jgi:hypothetical protein